MSVVKPRIFANWTLSEERVREITSAHMRCEYILFMEGAPDRWTCILETNDYDRAVSSTNFWDERVNVILLKRADLRYAERSHALALTREQVQEEFGKYGFDMNSEIGQSLARQLVRIQERTNEALAKLS